MATSTEARAGKIFRSGNSRYPDPPSHLDPAVKEIWANTIVSKPVEFWDPGNLVLFEQFCIMVLQMRAATWHAMQAGSTQQGLHSSVVSAEFDVMQRVTSLVMRLADKLRLSPQADIAADREHERNRKGQLHPFLFGINSNANRT